MTNNSTAKVDSLMNKAEKHSVHWYEFKINLINILQLHQTTVKLVVLVVDA